MALFSRNNNSMEKEEVKKRQKTKMNKKKERKREVVIPYVKGLSESIRRVFKSYEVPMYFKPANTLRQLLVRPKDKVEKDKIVGPVYHIACAECEASCIGETERSLRARFQEHRRPSSTTSEVSRHIHVDQPDHSIDIEKTRILAVEPRWFEHGVKETIYIRNNSPTLNREAGRYLLPHVWNNLLKSQTRGAQVLPSKLPISANITITLLERNQDLLYIRLHITNVIVTKWVCRVWSDFLCKSDGLVSYMVANAVNDQCVSIM